MISLVIFVVQLLLFTLLAIGLHYASPRIGLAPILFFVAGIVGLLNVIEFNALVITLPNNITLCPGGHIFIPMILSIMLMLYVVQGTRAAQVTMVGIIFVNLLVLTTLLFNGLYQSFISEGTVVTGLFNDNNTFDPTFIRSMVASVIALVADMLIMIIIWQGIANHFKWIPRFVIPGIAIIVALWVDTIIFNIGAFAGTPNFDLTIPSDVIMKSAAGLIVAPFVGVYLTFIAPKLPIFAGVGKRHSLAILFRSALSDSKLETLESELRISRTVYNQLTQNIEEIFWLIDINEQRFIYVSPAYERITQYSVDPLYEDIKNLLKIIHEEDRQYTENDILQFLVNEHDTEFRIIKPNNIVRWIRARSFPIKDESGKIIRYAGIAEDITERKKLTEQDFELALTHERMKLLRDFIQDASHDLKTPLSSMILKIDLLGRIQDEQRRTEIRAELLGRAKYLSELITDLFALSRIEGDIDIPMSAIDLNMIVEGVAQDTKILAEQKELDLILNYSDESAIFEGNTDQIHRVVSNLLTNAIRYTETGCVTVTTVATDSEVMLQVTDTGIGIKEENLDKVFDRFFRTQKAKDTQDGTGLGLAICKAIVDKHHGSLTVESAVGVGSTFSFNIPKAQPQKPELSQDTRRITQEIRALS